MGRKLIVGLLSTALGSAGVRDKRLAEVLFEGQYCRKEHLPHTEFNRYDITCPDQPDELIYDGTRCEYQCLDVLMPYDQAHNRTIECHCIDPPEGSVERKNCIWKFLGRDDADIPSYMCGKHTYVDLFVINKENKDRIKEDSRTNLNTIKAIIDDVSEDVTQLIADNEAAICQLHKDVRNSVDTRKAEDDLINYEIDFKMLAMNDTFHMAVEHSNLTLEYFIAETYDGFHVNVTQEVKRCDLVKQRQLDDNLDNLEKWQQAEQVNWTRTIVDTTESEMDALHVHFDDLAAAFVSSSIQTFDDSIISEEAAIGTNITTLGDTLVGSQTDMVDAANTTLIQNVTTVIEKVKQEHLNELTAEVTELKTDLETELDLLQATETLVTGAADDQDKMLEDVSTALKTNIDEMKTTLRTQIETDSPPNVEAAKTYLTERFDAIKERVSTKLDDAQAEMNEINAEAREDALQRAFLYTDDIQSVLEFNLEEKIDVERFKIADSIAASRNELTPKLEACEEDIRTKLDEADKSYNGTMSNELNLLKDMVTTGNTTHQDGLELLRDNLCQKMHSAGNFTEQLIVHIKSTVSEKIAKLVKTVQYEMEHSKYQLNLLRANSFF